MASPIVVKKALQAFANNYGKTDQWVEDTLKLWARGLASIHDKDLIRGTEEWCKNRARPPNLARLRELIEANPKTLSAAVIAGCPACATTGWREMARWYEMKKRTIVWTGVAACDCPKGVTYQQGGVPQWDRMRDSWNADPFTDAVYHSTAQQYHLTTEQRITPEKLAEHKAAIMKAKSRTSANVGSWKKVTR